jgi:hypothetical protein
LDGLRFNISAFLPKILNDVCEQVILFQDTGCYVNAVMEELLLRSVRNKGDTVSLKPVQDWQSLTHVKWDCIQCAVALKLKQEVSYALHSFR